MNESRPEGIPAPWRDLDGREAVPHGWRATFRTWVDDTRPAYAEAAEKALAHEDRNAVSRAYRRSDLLDLRIPLMAAWAEHCEGTTLGAVHVGQRRTRRMTIGPKGLTGVSAPH
jgi:hypothetical protein